jgi:hypothetical protein
VKFTCFGPFIPATAVQHMKVSNDFTGAGETLAIETAAATIMLQGILESADQMPEIQGDEIPVEEIVSIGTMLPF